MVDKTGLWLPGLGVLQIENLSTAGNFKLNGNLIVWNKPSKKQKETVLKLISSMQSKKRTATYLIQRYSSSPARFFRNDCVSKSPALHQSLAIVCVFHRNIH